MTREDTDLTPAETRFLKRYVPLAAFVGGLCCFTPVVTVLLGLGSVSYAASLSGLLYGQYAWAFRLAGLAVLLAGFVVHLYTNEGVCSLDEVTRRRQKISNFLSVTLLLGALASVLWLSVIVELMGLALGIW